MNNGPLTFVLAFAQAVQYRLGALYSRLPFLPVGRQFNVEFIYSGTINAGNQLAQLIGYNGPAISGGSGPIFLDGVYHKYLSLVGEITIMNSDPTNSLDVFLVSSQGQVGVNILKFTLPPGAIVNEEDREINPGTYYFTPHAPATSCEMFVDCWAIAGD